MALTGGGRVWTCVNNYIDQLGNNYNGQLGHGDETGKHLFPLVDPGHVGGASIVEYGVSRNPWILIPTGGNRSGGSRRDPAGSTLDRARAPAVPDTDIPNFQDNLFWNS
jgi:hypothetical protein